MQCGVEIVGPFLAPGNVVGHLTDLSPDSGNGQILRIFANTILWGVVAIALVLVVMI